ncbi:MAG: nicotinate-nucleotide adenylyltransferase [Fusobacteria bacterium]|nr:MAG: nicotinate-nucleotide adenylyltransferase [Fusobacteriota bacterium]KAF0230029.1 MAG: nicotinate-nucleotide [Fusobacteriota bacterium]
MKRIGLFGGTFNPIHNGHLQLAEGALKLFKLDNLYFIPTGKSYHKEVTYMPETEDRLKILELAIDNNDKFLISDCDIKRDGPTYTVDTIADMKKIETDARFFWVMGSDALLDILNWNDIEKIARRTTFLVALRHGDSKLRVEIFRDTLPSFLEGKVLLFEWPIQNISSNQIKKNMINKKYLPKKVYEYIKLKGLYNDATNKDSN